MQTASKAIRHQAFRLTTPLHATFSLLCAECHAVEKMTRNSNALRRDGSVMADLDLVDFLKGSRDSAINFSSSADLHTPVHPLQSILPHLTPSLLHLTATRKVSSTTEGCEMSKK